MKSRFLIVAIGIVLGLGARFLFNPSENIEKKKFAPADIRPVDILNEINLPADQGMDKDGLIKPIELAPGQKLDFYVSRDELMQMARDQIEYQFDSQTHDERATFHAHGEKICASGCAASRHPTEKLPAWKFAKLMQRYGNESLPDEVVASRIGPNAGAETEGIESETGESEKPTALDELIYYGRQSRQLLLTEGTFDLDQAHVDFLKKQLRCTHAKIEIRVVDEHGVIRTWLPSTRVPFDRRHVFDMEEKNLQPLVTSGTVKRVGLDYLWVRL